MVALMSVFSNIDHRIVHGVDALWSVHRALCYRGMDSSLQGESPWPFNDQPDALRDIHGYVDTRSSSE